LPAYNWSTFFMANHDLELPRLVYFGTQVESSYASEAVLYRLLQGYAPDKLLIVERPPYLSNPDRRLPRVEYRRLPAGMARLLHTRLYKTYVPVFLILSRIDARILWKRISDFCPQAVLTLHKFFAWPAATYVAHQRRLPLHLIMHDDYLIYRELSPYMLVRSLYRHHTLRAYKQAATRHCISPQMVDEYERRYGVRGTVLFPGRAKDAPRFGEPAARVHHFSNPFVVALGGNLYSDVAAEISEALVPLGGRLLLFGPHRTEDVKRWDAGHGNIEFRGLVSSPQMIQAFRDEADCIFIPIPFASSDRALAEFSFPSKLTDSTIPGVPLLIYGPPYASAVRWARANPHTALIVDQPGAVSLSRALKQLADDRALRVRLAEGALRVGERDFDYHVTRDRFFQSLT
jgi:hypothetical protein